MTSKKSELLKTDQSMSLEESFHNCFFYFMKAIDVLALDAAEQCEVMGNFNVSWEIQHDVLDGGTSLINWPAAYLSEPEKDAIREVITPLKELPEDALLNDHEKAMNHPAWSELRVATYRLRIQLDHAIKRNTQFFDSKKPQ